MQGATSAMYETFNNVDIPTNKQTSYRGCTRGECSQNVVVICDFNLIFGYVVVGWEETTYESRILIEIINDPIMRFSMPPSSKHM